MTFISLELKHACIHIVIAWSNMFMQRWCYKKRPAAGTVVRHGMHVQGWGSVAAYGHQAS